METIEQLKKEIEELKKELDKRPTYEEVQKMINEIRNWAISTFPTC